MPAAVTIVAGAASLAVAYGQLLSRPDDLARRRRAAAGLPGCGESRMPAPCCW